MEALLKREYRYLTIYDVLTISHQDTPMVVLSANLKSWISRRIIFWSNYRERAKHAYSHAMFLLTPETLATQGLMYARSNLTDWITDYIRLKFWYCEGWTPEDRKWLRNQIKTDLAAPCYRRIYDAPGVLGQWLENVFGIGACVNVPFIHFCSSRTAKPIRLWTPGLPSQPDPAGMDAYFENQPDWTVYGVYDPTIRTE